MSTENNITFENDNFKYKSRVIFGQSEVPKMARFLIGKGIVKNEKQAQGVLFGITLLLFISSFVLIYINFFKETNVPEISIEEQVLIMEQGLINSTQ